MSLHLSRSEKIIASVAFLSVGLFIFMFMQVNFRSQQSNSQFENRNQINYEMVRPEETFSEYSINGREIEHVYEELNKKETLATQAKPNKKTSAENIKKTEAAKKANLAKKAETAKKKSSASTQKFNQNKNNQAASVAQKKSELSQKSSKKIEAASHLVQPKMMNSSVLPESVPPLQPELNVQNNKQKSKKTFAEWRALLFSKPNRESMNLFIEAFRKKEVTQTEMQAMAQDLLDQSDDQYKGLGLYALRASPSLASLSQLVHIESELTGSYKAYVDQSYLAYLQPQNLSYLNQALQTKDKSLIVKSLNLLGFNLQKLSQGDFTSLIDSRNLRDADTQTQFSMNTFKSLIPALNSLGASQDQDISGMAQQIVGYIMTANQVALN